MDRRGFINMAGGSLLAVSGSASNLFADDNSRGSNIAGTCDPAFDKVFQAFEANFRHRGEVGAAVCVYKNGQKIVDLWGGIANISDGKLWAEDTIVCMMSVGKSMAALSVLMLVDRGRIDLDTPVAHYWPGFAQAGKGEITVRTLLTGKAGVLYADHAADGAAYDWEAMIAAFELQEPAWEPGTDGAYHSMSMGFLLGELVHRVDGRMINRFFAEEIAAPLDIDYQFGLDDASIARVSDIIPNPESVTLTEIGEQATKLARAWRIAPRVADPFNSDTFRRAIFPSANGHGNARAIARVYAGLAAGGTIDGVQLISPELMEVARSEAWKGTCAMTGRQFRYGHGFFLNYPPLVPLGPNSGAFGHPGAGGAIGLADPEAKMSFSYSPNFMTGGAGVGDRCAALINAAFDSDA